MMQIDSVENTVDPNSGEAVNHVDLRESAYDEVEVRRTAEGDVIVTAIPHDGDTKSWRFAMMDEVFYGLANYAGTRRDVDEDVQDTLLEVGYTVLNRRAP